MLEIAQLGDNVNLSLISVRDAHFAYSRIQVLDHKTRL